MVFEFFALCIIFCNFSESKQGRHQEIRLLVLCVWWISDNIRITVFSCLLLAKVVHFNPWLLRDYTNVCTSSNGKFCVYCALLHYFTMFIFNPANLNGTLRDQSCKKEKPIQLLGKRYTYGKHNIFYSCSFQIKVCGICCLVCALTCVLVTITTTVIHMNRLQTLRECVYTQKTRTCTCYSVLLEAHASTEEGC